MDDYVDTMTLHYAVAALWSSLNWEWINAVEAGQESRHTGENLDADYDVEDIHPDTYAAMRADCAAFVEAARDGEWNGTGADLIGDMDPEQCGHDFWLTRNGHGVGFWDRGYGERGDQLSAIADPFGEVHLYAGDDNMIHGE